MMLLLLPRLLPPSARGSLKGQPEEDVKVEDNQNKSPARGRRRWSSPGGLDHSCSSCVPAQRKRAQQTRRNGGCVVAWRGTQTRTPSPCQQGASCVCVGSVVTRVRHAVEGAKRECGIQQQERQKISVASAAISRSCCCPGRRSRRLDKMRLSRLKD